MAPSIFIAITIIETPQIWNNTIHVTFYLFWINISIDISTITVKFYGKITLNKNAKAQETPKNFSGLSQIQIGLETAFERTP